MEMGSAYLFLTNAKLTLKTEIVSHASKATILKTDNASSQNQIMLSPQTQAAALGTGTIKSA